MAVKELTKQEDRSTSDLQPEQQQQRIKSSALDKINAAIANAALAIARMFAHMFDRMFGTSLAKSDSINKTVRIGTPVPLNKNKQQVKEEIKISKAKASDNNEDTQVQEDRENHPDGKLSIKDVLRGHYSDTDIQKQQDELAKEGHRVFKVAGNQKEQTQAVSR